MTEYVPKPINRGEAAMFDARRAVIDHLVDMEPGQTVTIRELGEWIYVTRIQELAIAHPGFERNAAHEMACDVLWSPDASTLLGSRLVGREVVFTRRAVA